MERLERGDLARRRYQVLMDRGALLLTVVTDRAGLFRALDLEETIAGR